MDMYDLVIQNKEIFKVLYSALIILICMLIVFKTDKLFRLSLHNGIRYFRNAFFFFGLGFASRYFGKFIFEAGYAKNLAFLPVLFFEFFVTMAGFFLLYSLIWKKLESDVWKSKSSLLNLGVIIFYMLAIIIVVMNYLWETLAFMFFSQIIVFFVASIISLVNSRNEKAAKHNFPKFYFIAMVLALIVWVLNTLAVFYFNWNKIVIINIYMLNAIFFLIFLYGVIKATRS